MSQQCYRILKMMNSRYCLSCCFIDCIVNNLHFSWRESDILVTILSPLSILMEMKTRHMRAPCISTLLPVSSLILTTSLHWSHTPVLAIRIDLLYTQQKVFLSLAHLFRPKENSLISRISETFCLQKVCPLHIVTG